MPDCKQCRERIDDDCRFCPYCGVRIDAPAPAKVADAQDDRSTSPIPALGEAHDDQAIAAQNKKVIRFIWIGSAAAFLMVLFAVSWSMADFLMSVAAVGFLAALGGLVKPYIKGWTRKQFGWATAVIFGLAMIVAPFTMTPEQRAAAEAKADKEAEARLKSEAIARAVKEKEEAAEREREAVAEATKVAAAVAAKRKEQMSGLHCLSGWDGSHRAMVGQIENNLRNPSSFEHIETRITPAKNGRHIVIMQYRAENGFGGMNIERATGTIEEGTCRLLEVVTL